MKPMNGTGFGHDLSLTPDQEGLLRTALSSNNPSRGSPQNSGSSRKRIAPSNGVQTQNIASVSANDAGIYASPLQQTPGSGQLSGFDESPFLDFDLDDGNFDWDNSGEQFFGDLPGADLHDDGEHNDKRKASTDNEDEDENSNKRHEGDEKTAKKPGRKPLTAEPTTKRKAQNRAAQRAFRERKERHVKDLETKVEDLEKASEAANHENGRLRVQVEKLNVELKEYRKRLSLNTTGASHSPPHSTVQSRSLYDSSSDDFQFNFPKFGDLPGSFMTNGSIAKTSPNTVNQRPGNSPDPNLPGAARKQSSSSANTKSPLSASSTGASFRASTTNSFNNSNYGDLNGLFSPSILQSANSASSADYLSYPGSNVPSTNGLSHRDSIGSPKGQNLPASIRQQSSTSITGSPNSLMSHGPLDSSNGTTPESSADSPDIRKSSEGVLDTTSEDVRTRSNIDATSNIGKPPAFDINGIDWMAQQNGGAFDPVLFGDYRDPQDNILNNNFGDFFNDAFPGQDFGSPYNTGDLTSAPPKKDLMKEIEVRQNEDVEKIKPGDSHDFLTSDKLMDRVQASAQSGEVDMDDLCSQLKSKAKCSSKGAVIARKDVDEILGPAPTEPMDFLKMFSMP